METDKLMFTQPKSKNENQSTNKIILDYLLYLSIQSRLKQARVELLELSTPLHKDETLEVRKKRWIETASKAEKDKNAVESVVAGILSSHFTRKPSFQLDSNFEQRLHLCQLTNLVFGRFDALSTGQHVIAHSSSSRRRRHHESSTEVLFVAGGDEDFQQRQKIFGDRIIPPFCRRHRIQGCYGCRSPYLKEKPEHAMKMAQVHHIEEEETKQDEQSQFRTLDIAAIAPPTPPAGLIEAIPTFLRTSADMLRRMLEKDDNVTFAGQKVMGGGMPPRWYDLFLELLTQAAIESYLCDTQAGLEPIFEIFSYGDVEDEDEEHEEEEDDEEDEDEEEHAAVLEEEEALDEWGIRAADHHLLFPKTRTMYLFKTQVREREKDFLVVQDGVDLKTHFEKLAHQFPLQAFEKSMGDFIQMILGSMDVPALDEYEYSDDTNENSNNNNKANPNNKNTNTSESRKDNQEEQAANNRPKVYKYPGDGSLLMPEVPDEEEKTVISSSPLAQEPMIHEVTKKRRGSNLEASVELKRTK
ncbi:hypothetical protein K501DRAFT_282917 [Backusella circina FSU 941]|nr:hypothetical protein K501DRAFT_282917 [Backusella circina FSU 941]